MQILGVLVGTRATLVGLCAGLLLAAPGVAAEPASAGSAQSRAQDSVAIGTALDSFHRAAAAGDWSTYFDLMSDDAVFIGTDAAERWPKAQFQSYAGNRAGWVYTPSTRHINLSPSGDSAWFDEILISASYGTSRGTGVLIRTGSGWKISQYHLTFPIPNALAARFTEEIRQFEQEQAEQ